MSNGPQESDSVLPDAPREHPEPSQVRPSDRPDRDEADAVETMLEAETGETDPEEHEGDDLQEELDHVNESLSWAKREHDGISSAINNARRNAGHYASPRAQSSMKWGEPSTPQTQHWWQNSHESGRIAARIARLEKRKKELEEILRKQRASPPSRLAA